MTTQPNERLQRTAWLMEHQAAPLTTIVLTAIRDSLNGDHNRPGQDAGKVSGSHGPTIAVHDNEGRFIERIPATSVEVEALARIDTIDLREELRDRLDGAIIGLTGYLGWLRATARTLGVQIDRIVPDLCDGTRSTSTLRAWEGHQLVWVANSRDPRNGWIDPTCRKTAGTSGLCPTCLLRMNRWRQRNDLTWISEAAAA